jgi:L-asparaginase / beta-aspartyl-peptidase
MPRLSLILHGGAGDVQDNEVIPYREGIRAAAKIGWGVLKHHGSALDAVEEAINAMESDPVFDAGRGSYPNTDGQVEMDAIIMDGATLKNGAVAGIRNVLHPVSVARLVMEKTPHCFFVGAGAETFARIQGVAFCSDEDLLYNPYRVSAHPISSHDTVGAIALDANGHLAVATSTGGVPGKMPGRVGDSPLIGCGAFADDMLGAASATGRGEDLMKIVISKTACDLMAQGIPPKEAAPQIIDLLKKRVNGVGGIILMDHLGEIGFAFNAARMSCAWVTQDGRIEADVFETHPTS